MRFTVRRNTRSHPGEEMGFRSPLVLAKLGFDLRAQYEYLLDEPLPEEISGPIQALEAAEASRQSATR